MANTKTTEGHTEYSGCSDLTLGISLCQSVPNPPMNVGEPWATIGRAANLPNGSMRVCHGAGITEEENKAGRWTDISSPAFLRTSGRLDGSGVIGWPNHSVKPAIEKEARLRSQHHFTFGGGAGLNNQSSLWRN